VPTPKHQVLNLTDKTKIPIIFFNRRKRAVSCTGGCEAYRLFSVDDLTADKLVVD